MTAVELRHEHVHPLAAVHLHLFPNDVGLDRQLPATAIDQDTQRDAFGAPEVRQLVERGPHGAARIQHVVHDHDVLAGEIARDAGFPDHGLRAHCLEVVAIQGDVEGAAGDGRAFVGLDLLGDPLGQLDAAPLDADQDQILGPVGQLEHFDRHTLKRPRQSAGVQDGGPFGPAHLRRQVNSGNTGVNGGPPASTAWTFASATVAMRRRVSGVALPRCGSSTVRGAARRRGWICGSSR